MKTYEGSRGRKGIQISVTEEGRAHQLDINPSLKIRKHSPSGFDWGYGGSGPAQLALALLLDATGSEGEAEVWYQRFKALKVMFFSHDSWIITDSEILAWLEDAQAGELGE